MSDEFGDGTWLLSDLVGQNLAREPRSKETQVHDIGRRQNDLGA
jgi:hypothetical protein